MKSTLLGRWFTNLCHQQRPRPTRRLGVQALEERWTPATLVSPTQVTYKDIDGDQVRVTFSKPILTSLTVANLVFQFNNGDVDNGSAAQQQLWKIDLRSVPNSNGTDIRVQVEGTASGSDSKAHVGYIDGLERDVGTINIQGDLGRFRFGNANVATPTVKALIVDSIGAKGITTQAPGGHLRSAILGPVGKIVTIGNIEEATISISSDAGRLGRLEIGGSLIARDGQFSGRISASNTIDVVRVGGNVVGGGASSSGFIVAGKRLGDVKIGGSLLGGDGALSGLVGSEGTIGRLTLGGNVVGGKGDMSGRIETTGNMGTITIAGSVIGGAGAGSGRIITAGKIASVQIVGDLDGANGGDGAGQINAEKTIGRVTIGGNVLGGDGNKTGHIYGRGGLGTVTIGGTLLGSTGTQSGWIYSRGDIANIRINGLLYGGSLVAEGNLGNVHVEAGIYGFFNRRVLIAGGGVDTLAPAGIGKLTVNGDVVNADILAGYVGGSFNPPSRQMFDVRIGSVSVRGNWVMNNLVAGVDIGPDNMFGTADDGASVKGKASFTSAIGSLTIGGRMEGSATVGDRFAVLAESVGSVTINGTRVALKAGRLNDALVILPTQSNYGDVVLMERAA